MSFLNLNLVHSYYQVYLIPGVAVAIAYGIGRLPSAVWQSRLLALVVAEGLTVARLEFYRGNDKANQVGGWIKSHTRLTDIVAVVSPGVPFSYPVTLFLRPAKRI